MKYLKSLSLLILLFISTSLASVSAQDKKITLEDIWKNYTFYPRGISGIRSMNNGVEYTILSRNCIIRYSYETGEVIDTLLDGNRFEELKKNPVQRYEFSENEESILLTVSIKPIYRHSFLAKNYVYYLKNKQLKTVADGQYQQLAALNPEGSKVAYMRDNNIYIYDIESEKEEQITFDGEKNKIINGAPDWVYEEEFGFSRGFYWSPDGNKIAYYKFDESNVKEYTLTFYEDLYPRYETYKYPKAGEDNSVVTLHIYHLKGNKTVDIDVGDNPDQYIPRIKWTNNSGELAFIRMNRLQNELEILLGDVQTGHSKVIFKESNPYYIEITDDWYFLKSRPAFVWTSEKDGFNHIYLYSMDGKLIRQLTKGNWDVVQVLGVDEDRHLIYYSAALPSPTQKSVWSVSFKGGKPKKLTTGDGTNNVVFSSNFSYYINTYSTANTPPVTTLYQRNGKKVRVLEDNNALKELLKDYAWSNKEFFQFTTRQGVQLNGWIIKPVPFEPEKKYPVLMTVYGGPGHNTVNDQWEYSMLWHEMLAENGYVVVSVDPRGTGFRGQEFKKSTYMQLGKLETEDMIESAKYLATLPFVDKDRIGIWGWSYGGYLSSLSLFKGADYFKMAIAVAPVTNWRFYDNIYTERYMRKPQDNAEGYDSNSPINFVQNLKGKFLLIHGSADDNVHFQNSMELAEALHKANKQFDMHVYPNKNHGIYGGLTRYHLYRLMTNYIYKNL